MSEDRVRRRRPPLVAALVFVAVWTCLPGTTSFAADAPGTAPGTAAPVGTAFPAAPADSVAPAPPSAQQDPADPADPAAPSTQQDPADPADPGDPDEADDPAGPYRPDPGWGALSRFRVERSPYVGLVPFGDPDDPRPRPGILSLADLLRLAPGLVTRELSQGPTAESFSVRGTGSERSGLLLGGRSLVVPGTAGPRTNEVALSEVSALRVVRGGTAALYGPDALSGALIVEPRFPAWDELVSRAEGEEGVDGYQRGAFQIGQPIGVRGGWFLNAESRRIDGFFDGAKEVDRQVSGAVRGRLTGDVHGAFRYRRFETDARSGGFEQGPVASVLSKRSDFGLELYAPRGPDSGALLELELASERLENVGGDEPRTIEIRSPGARLTADLPDFVGFRAVARAEATRWRFEDEEAATVDSFWRAAAALRVTRALGAGASATLTARLDSEERRPTLHQLRAEAGWSAGALELFGVASRGERLGVRGSGRQRESLESAEIGARWAGSAFRARAVAFGARLRGRRADPEFEDVRRHESPISPMLPDADLVGVTVGADTSPLRVPGLGFLGDVTLDTSVTRLSAEDESGARLPGRPTWTWTGEGFLEKSLFQDDLLARVRGRLTHYGDRPVDADCPNVDVWLTDVILEGEVGDAIFFYRFHDLLARADDVEPCYRFPGFSRMYGISWRFRG